MAYPRHLSRCVNFDQICRTTRIRDPFGDELLGRETAFLLGEKPDRPDSRSALSCRRSKPTPSRDRESIFSKTLEVIVRSGWMWRRRAADPPSAVPI